MIYNDILNMLEERMVYLEVYIQLNYHLKKNTFKKLFFKKKKKKKQRKLNPEA